MKNLMSKGKAPITFLADAYNYYLKELGVINNKVAEPYTPEEDKKRLLAYAKAILALLEYRGNKNFKFDLTENGTVISIYLRTQNMDVLLVQFDLETVEKIKSDSSARLYLLSGYGSILTEIRNYSMKKNNSFIAM